MQLSSGGFRLQKTIVTLNVLILGLLLGACSSIQTTVKPPQLILGAEQDYIYLPLLKDKRVGLIVNQTSTVGETHLLDFLISKGVNVRFVFAPEHGFRGTADAGEHIIDSKDPKTGVKIVSIYGQNKQPSSEIMAELDWLIFDIQDVGVRFYTYISSMHYMMEAASENQVSFMVLDRPNPNGRFVEGFLLEEAFQSFVGMHPIPVLHGMTVGELANMIIGEKWLDSANELDLHVIPMRNYSRALPYDLPIKPSPNLPNSRAIMLYPHLCLFEPTTISVGRGTDFPFQVLGHPKGLMGQFNFTPKPTQGASVPKWNEVRVKGEDLRQSNIQGFDLQLLVKWYDVFKDNNESFFKSESFFDKLAGTDKLRKALKAGLSSEEIKLLWIDDVEKFKVQRRPYLLYP